jgi:hypothetical protein
MTVFPLRNVPPTPLEWNGGTVERMERNAMTTDRWTLTLAGLLGEPWPPLPALPGRVHRTTDAPMTDAELAGISSPTELALILGISRQAAHARLKKAQLHNHPADAEGSAND